MTRSENVTKKQGKLGIVSSTEYISVDGIENVPAKIDTGADSSSVWASNIEVTDKGVLRFTLFAPGSKYYTGEVLERIDFAASSIKSSNGIKQIRYRAKIPIVINGRKIRVLATLSDRSKNHFPILIGRKTLSGRFLVDVSKSKVERPHDPKRFTKELKEDPIKFHQKYFKKDNK